MSVQALTCRYLRQTESTHDLSQACESSGSETGAFDDVISVLISSVGGSIATTHPSRVIAATDTITSIQQTGSFRQMLQLL